MPKNNKHYKRKRGFRVRGGLNLKGYRANAELKFFDSSNTDRALTAPTDMSGGEANPSATVSLSSIAQGDGQSQRDGRRVTFHSLYVNGVINVPIQTNQTASEEQGVVFIALVLDHQTNGSLMSSESVYSNPSASALTNCVPFRNLAQTKRFTVLKTWRRAIQVPFAVFDGTNIEQYGKTVPFSIYHKFNTPIIATYTGTDGTISTQVDNSLHLIAFVTNADAGQSLSYQSRLRFMG